MSDDRFKAGLPVFVFLLLALAIVGVGYYVFQQQAGHLKESSQRELATIADLKAEQIVRWRSERQGDAQVMSQDYFFGSAVAQWLQEGSQPGEHRQRILDRLTALQRAYDYQDVALLDDQGTLRLATAATQRQVSGVTRDLAIEAMRTGTIQFSDLHRAEEEPDQPIRIDFLAPLLDKNRRALGVLLFRIDPNRFLFPLIQSWPSPSACAETELVEHSGNEVLFLNELRHQKQTALTLRFPITEAHLTAALAARGQEGVFEGVDYRNVPVLAATRKIPGSPWIIVAKVDQQEVYAPIHERTLLTAEFTIVLVALAGVLTALWWREQSARLVTRDYQNRLERQALIQHFDYLAKYANDIIFLYDSDFKIVEMNDRALAAYGYTREELLGLHISELRTPETAAEFDRHRQQLEEREALVYEVQAMRKDKTVFPVEVSTRMIVTEGRTFYQSIIRDITERKRAEEALRLADRRKDEFLAMLAHELRNPLAPISNAVAILKLPELAPAQLAQCADMINRQVKHLARLVDDLLDVSRISRGLVELKKEPLEVRNFILPAVETSRPLLDARRHTVSLALPPEPVWVEGDRIRLAQVVSNLLNNAAKYTQEEGHIELSVEASSSDVRIQVSDNGCGIDPVDLAHLFDLFYQVDRNLDRAQGGLGIGLSLVHNLVALHGGKVQAFSAGRGQGSEFVVRLPRLIHSPSTLPVSAEPAASCPNKRRILVVDDNRDIAESLALLLESEGHQVLKAFDGIAALEIARIERPDIILLDIGLPGLDGYAVAQALRQNHELERTMLIALTGYGQPDDRKKSSASGFDEHLVKPIDIEKLRELLASYPTTRGHESP